MISKITANIKIGTLCGISFIIISYFIFRTDLPKIPSILLYNLVVIISLQKTGFYRGIFFLGAAVFFTVLISLAKDFHYIWNLPLFFVTFLIANDRIKKLNYFKGIIERRIDEIKENMNLIGEEYSRHKKDDIFLERKEQRYSSLKDVTSVLSSTFSIDKVTELILDSALKIIGKSESALLFLIDVKKQELNLVRARIKKDFESTKAKKGDLLDKWVFKQRHCLLVEDIKKDFRFGEEGMREYERPYFRSAILSPLIGRKKIMGIVRLEHSKPNNYTSEDLRLLDILCDLGVASLQNAEFYKETLDFAITDGLTELYLRKFFLDRLREELERSLQDKFESSFLMIDIDDFKKYNDKYGHMAGDIVLKTLSRVFRDFAKNGIVARYGGEEFSILLPGTSKTKAKEIAEDIRKAVKKETIYLRRIKTSVTVSIGLSSVPEDGKLQNELILKADERLYMAKKKGKNRVVAE